MWSVKYLYLPYTTCLYLLFMKYLYLAYTTCLYLYSWNICICPILLAYTYIHEISVSGLYYLPIPIFTYTLVYIGTYTFTYTSIGTTLVFWTSSSQWRCLYYTSLYFCLVCKSIFLFIVCACQFLLYYHVFALRCLGCKFATFVKHYILKMSYLQTSAPEGQDFFNKL